ncbi:MAG TPA: mandelate racemase/muconate lactonizing enzyme family protein [Acidobacteriota bacterium]|nr:mandelate racemase/muconate lactonizing enzyme family protein [Acidobacteriota bacterium]
MNRRHFVHSLAGAGGAVLAARMPAAPSSKMKITRIRYCQSTGDAAQRKSNVPGLFNQSTNVVVVETDAGLSGIGEGGAKDTLEQCAAAIIGMDPFRTEEIWQILYRGYFYPAGREKLHAIGALDTALWDIKGKALGAPVYRLLGGPTREHVECYATGFPGRGTLKETARACVDAGYRAFRIGPADGNPWDRFEMIQKTFEHCKEAREGVGKDGAWAIDFHTRFDMADAVRLAQLVEPLGPYFVEDLVRSENPAVYRTLRQQVKVPIAIGEQFGARWDINELIEGHVIDYARVSIPNVGGITEFMKIAALCETHYIGLIPHFTGPISEAALVHAAVSFSGPILMEMLPRATGAIPHLPKCFDFREGKLWPNERPGIGVEFDGSKLTEIAVVSEYAAPLPIYRRPDGSITNW